jgi:hypothetical protein
MIHLGSAQNDHEQYAAWFVTHRLNRIGQDYSHVAPVIVIPAFGRYKLMHHEAAKSF